MNQAQNEEELAALPMWVVVRTATKQVRERGIGGQWYAMGVNWTEHQVTWEEEDFPVQVLWSYADEIAPPVLPSIPKAPYWHQSPGMVPTTIGGTSVQQGNSVLDGETP